jgi:hypothetical protein
LRYWPLSCGLSPQSDLDLDPGVRKVNLTRALRLRVGRVALHTAPATGITRDLMGATEAAMVEVAVMEAAVVMVAVAEAIDGRPCLPFVGADAP